MILSAASIISPPIYTSTSPSDGSCSESNPVSSFSSPRSFCPSSFSTSPCFSRFSTCSSMLPLFADADTSCSCSSDFILQLTSINNVQKAKPQEHTEHLLTKYHP